MRDTNNHAVALSIIIVSYNAREVLRQCLQCLQQEVRHCAAEVIVVDNASRDGSAEMVSAEFPAFQLYRSDLNLGFAGGNNYGYRYARGEYILLLNPDAFLTPGSLSLALQRMQEQPQVGLAGARLSDPQGHLQPSGRLFPSLLNEFLVMSGLSSRFPHSRLCGRFDRTWANPAQAAQVDWVPGAFTIIRRSALGDAGLFDERYFLYYEEVDLCRRLKQQGCQIWYWPELSVTHIGGACSKAVSDQHFSKSGSQLTLWRMRSALLYYRKHHGQFIAWSYAMLEIAWNGLRHLVRTLRHKHTADTRSVIQLMRQAWRDTKGGNDSPLRPW
ncbi:glycosyltransferase family 2 protein [Undibacterium squillarum]|uniref:Glycosyl transferase n=1 Tax=Undibacterium squillarum TaxID=1131567 RepID=A0ABQ2XW38_9BURK|nr:glycosyltransferase family 2 protein [Undibacterium squillarum]GGX36472.1 glycosyl transferase [Undibacterium squillarum]